ncbi:hypothetical protein LTR62_001981 [Meristemomyces frigidus]|uniref:Uncharacterized protein n=1 Tax=Meristemomyces frigidus TaxID=1508187 RepID=A0AAN7TFV9_9PEZI|nr:hypothetical protein LTR62_001981 [Meristemomyces frigidus]
MSWMDSWSRPAKSQATPAPLYLTHGDSVPYCHTCGRVIGQRRANTSKASSTAVKYCSDRCKKTKPSTAAGSLEVRIEEALTALLLGLPPPPLPSINNDNNEAEAKPPPPVVKPKQKPKKGDPRLIILLSELETAVFGDRSDPEKVYGRRKNRRARFIPEKGEWKTVDMVSPPGSASSSDDGEDDDDTAPESGTAGSLTDTDEGFVDGGGVSLNPHVRAPQTQSEVNFSVGGERGWGERIAETEEMLRRRREGQKRAEEKEMVKCAARRAVAFGLVVDAPADEGGKGGGGGGKRGGGKKGKGGATAAADVQEGGIGGEGGKIRRKCEALMNDQVVEPSFAKGDWSIRWRED